MIWMKMKTIFGCVFSVAVYAVFEFGRNSISIDLIGFQWRLSKNFDN